MIAGLPQPPDRYNQAYMQSLVTALARELEQCRAANADITLGPNTALSIQSPNGTKWRVTVTDAGALSIVQAFPGA